MHSPMIHIFTYHCFDEDDWMRAHTDVQFCRGWRGGGVSERNSHGSIINTLIIIVYVLVNTFSVYKYK